MTFFVFLLSNKCKGFTNTEMGVFPLKLLFEQEFEKHQKALFLIALSYVHNTEDAKDIVQEAALSAFQAMDSLRYPEYFKTWTKNLWQKETQWGLRI